ncbi:hypothetical protein PoB_006251900 [Plakobranchus ocellatus]|uniref:GRAM domain-containing protein n=1 Tax=Plakobranchus ocellatus TaxID=259542 RepID=A0AAV4CVV6_9GAST|nr:hypothetical protein PoB_006251900 [Plakobranchus ocellatus]
MNTINWSPKISHTSQMRNRINSKAFLKTRPVALFRTAKRGVLIPVSEIPLDLLPSYKNGILLSSTVTPGKSVSGCQSLYFLIFQPNQQTQEIGKLFIRLVDVSEDKPSDDTNTVDSQVGSIVPPTPVVPSSQQHQPPPLPSTQQPPPPHMMRPGPPNMGPPTIPPPTHMMPARPGMMQQQQPVPHVQPPATPPHHDIQRMNFFTPPPQIPLRLPTPVHVYSRAQQHLVRHPQQPQPVAPQQPQCLCYNHRVDPKIVSLTGFWKRKFPLKIGESQSSIIEV